MPSSIASPPFKIVLLGDSSVGKTSLVARFTTSRFNQNTANTIGAAFLTKEYTSNDRTVHYEIWDTAGQERYRSLTPMYYRNARVALVCFDLDNVHDSLLTAKYWIDQLAVNGGVDSDAPIKIKLIGNKHDLFESHADQSKQEEHEEIERFCTDNNIEKVWNTSAKEGYGITDLFDGIVNDIDPEFFEEHRQKVEEAKNRPEGQGQLGFLLNRRENTSKCC